MKQFYKFLLFIYVPCIFSEHQQWPHNFDEEPKNVLISSQNRANHLHECPGSVDEMLRFIIDFQIQKQNQSPEKHHSVLVTSKTVPVEENVEAENALLGLIPHPFKTVLTSVLLLKNVQYGKWFKTVFKIYPEISDDECREIINHNPYTAELFAQIHKIKSYLYQINSKNMSDRAIARIQILEAELPPPLDKKFKKAQKQFALLCSNQQGDLVQIIESIDAEKIFQKYINQKLADPQVFIKQIAKLKKYISFKSKEKMRSCFNRYVINLIAYEPQIDFIELFEICKKNNNEIIHELHKFFVEKRIGENYYTIKQDIIPGSKNPETASAKIQSELLLRSYYETDLEQWLCGHNGNMNCKQLFYQALGNVDEKKKPDIKYYFSFLDTFIKNNFHGIETSQEIQSLFFHESGILKKYVTDSFVQEHLLKFHLHSKFLHQAVNYALAIRDKINSYQIKEIAQEILNNAAKSLRISDQKISTMFENNAYFLYQKLVASGGEPILNSKKTDCFEGLSFAVDKQADQYKAYKATQEDGFREYFQPHEMSQKLKMHMQSHLINLCFFTNFVGNQFQHHIAEKILAAIEKSMVLSGQFTHLLIECADLAQSYNRTGNIAGALIALDLCQDIISYAEAVYLHSCDTTKNNYFMGCHPVQYISNMASTMNNLIKYHGINLDTIHHNQETAAFLSDLFEKIQHVYSNPLNKKHINMDMNFISNQWITKKSCAFLGKLCSKMINATKEYPYVSVTQVLEMIPYHRKITFACLGKALKISLENINNNTEVVLKSTKTDNITQNNFINAHQQQYQDFLWDYLGKHQSKYNVLQTKTTSQSYFNRFKSLFFKQSAQIKTPTPFFQAKILLKSYQSHGKILALNEKELQILNDLMKNESIKTRMAFGKIQTVTIKIKHIIQFFFKATKIGIVIDGMHSDFGGKIRQNGESGGAINIKKIAEKLGCYLAEVQCFNNRSCKKTFFPENWDARTIVVKINEALKNATWGKNNNNSRKPQCGFGYTNEGIKIKFICIKTANGLEILSAYPCKDWIKE